MGKKKGKKGLKKDKPKGNQIRASHILVEKLSEAQNILEDIEAGISFEKLAREHSNCPSKKRGGDLGIFGKGQMVPEFERAAYALKIGEISKPIKSKHGYHIIKRTG
ncbi:MAG: peptidylprolyl isomerase [Candidatus Helarchaeota archaeon]